ncbi:MAG: helix-turn-helix domain-containing protein, partial [Chloroflexota bacterium]
MSSLERALDLLTTLEKKGPSMGLSELSRAAGIHKATTQRLLCVLERRGFV